MSEEEDKNTLNDSDDSAANQRNIEGDSVDGGRSDSLLVNGNENSPPCQLDIGLGTHTDSRRHDNSSNDNGKCVGKSTRFAYN